jgi:hypothetical protein
VKSEESREASDLVPAQLSCLPSPVVGRIICGPISFLYFSCRGFPMGSKLSVSLTLTLAIWLTCLNGMWEDTWSEASVTVRLCQTSFIPTLNTKRRKVPLHFWSHNGQTWETYINPNHYLGSTLSQFQQKLAVWQVSGPLKNGGLHICFKMLVKELVEWESTCLASMRPELSQLKQNNSFALSHQ